MQILLRTQKIKSTVEKDDSGGRSLMRLWCFIYCFNETSNIGPLALKTQVGK